MKLKTLFQTIRRALRSLSAAKSKADRTLQVLMVYNPAKASKRRRAGKNAAAKNLFGSFRFHYNWCSSKRHAHVLPVPAPVYDATWHVGGDLGSYEESRLYGYLQWLEEEKAQGKAPGPDGARGDGNPGAEGDDIDRLADMFIASCHAKFILEKQESARRFKDMLERSA